jgi:hypothetical protein
VAVILIAAVPRALYPAEGSDSPTISWPDITSRNVTPPVMTSPTRLTGRPRVSLWLGVRPMGRARCPPYVDAPQLRIRGSLSLQFFEDERKHVGAGILSEDGVEMAVPVDLLKDVAAPGELVEEVETAFLANG